MINKDSIDCVIYHANCPDGMGAAYAAWLFLGDTAEYIPCSHGSVPPDVRGKTVIILDFSFPRVTIEKMYSESADMMILDHHKSAEENLGDLKYAYFDMKKSGAMLSWLFFHPDKSPPDIIRYIEDGDLWKWQLPYSNEYSMGLSMFPHSLDGYAQAACTPPDKIIEHGSLLLGFVNKQVDNITRSAAHRNLLGFNTLVVNSCQHTSRVGAKLLKDCDVALIWYYDHGLNDTRVSLRSSTEGNNIDVSKIAKNFGGGGHRNAAGFRLPKGTDIEGIFNQ